MTNKKILLQYAGLAMQLLIGLGLAAYGGLWVDKHFLHSLPLCVWIFPLLVLVAMIIKVVKDTSNKNNN